MLKDLNIAILLAHPFFASVTRQYLFFADFKFLSKNCNLQHIWTKINFSSKLFLKVFIIKKHFYLQFLPNSSHSIFFRLNNEFMNSIIVLVALVFSLLQFQGKITEAADSELGPVLSAFPLLASCSAVLSVKLGPLYIFVVVSPAVYFSLTSVPHCEPWRTERAFIIKNKSLHLNTRGIGKYLNESSPAGLTLVWLFSRVDARVGLEVSWSIELCATDVASIRLLSCKEDRAIRGMNL